METSSDRDYQDRRVGPTVSKEKWLNHAKGKLARGYMLIVGNERKSANFYLRDKGFEACSYSAAKQMIKDGIVVEAGRHPLGTMYKLAEDVVVPEPRKRAEKEPRPVPEEPAEDAEIILGDLVVEEVEEDAEDDDAVDEEDDEIEEDEEDDLEDDDFVK